MPDVNQNDIQTVTFDELDVIDAIANGDKMLVKTTDGVAKTIMKEGLFREVEANREAGDTLLQGQITTLMGESGLHEKANLSLKGANNGLAELDENGKVPSSQLPSFVDDVIEGYYYQGAFYRESAHTTLITPETGKIYVNLTDDKTYRWGGSAYVVISESLALGETSSTAYRGDRGKTAYDHSQLRGTGIYSDTNPHSLSKDDIGLGNVPNVTTDNQTPTVTEASSLTNLAENDTLKTIVGKVKKAIGSLIAHLNNTSNPHTVTKAQVGLGDVVNTGDSATPVSGGTTKFTTGGAYTELAKKVNTTVKVNGHALSSDVTVTKSDVGLGNVVNTGDSATPVNGGDSKFTTGGAYKLLTSFAPYFSSSTAYAVGDYVTYEGLLYKCTTAHSAGAWNSAHFTQTQASTMTGGGGYDVLPVNKGGTGATTEKEAEYNIIGSVEQVNTAFDDTKYIAVQNQTVSASNGTFRWFRMSNLWTYIQNRISSVLGLTASQYGGNSATATTLTQWGRINTISDKAVEGLVIYDYLVNTLNIKPLSESSASKFAVLPISLTTNSTYRLSYLLLCDITALNGVTSGGSSYGFVGKIYAHRLGGFLREHCSDWILTASYNESDSQGDSLRLLTTDTLFTPVKIKNENTGKTYLAIEYDYGKETNITLAGTFANITTTPSIVNLKLDTNFHLVDSNNVRWTVKCRGYKNMLNIDNAGTREGNAPTATTANTAKSLGAGNLVNKLTSTVPSGYIDVTGRNTIEPTAWKESYYAGMFYKSESGDSFYYYRDSIYFNDTVITGISSIGNPLGKMVERQGAYYLLINNYLYKYTTGSSFTRVSNYSNLKDIMISSNGTFYVLRSRYGLYTLSTSDNLTQVVSESSTQNCLFETSDGTILVGGDNLWKVNGSSYQTVYNPSSYDIVAIGENNGYIYIQIATLKYIYYGTLSGTFTQLSHNLGEGVSFVHQKFGNDFYIIGKSSSTTALVYKVTGTTPTLTQVNSFTVQAKSSYYYQVYQDDEGVIYVNNYQFRDKSEGSILLSKSAYANLYAVVGDEYTPSGTDSALFGVPYCDCDNGKMLLAY